MGRPVSFPGANRTLGPPAGADEISVSAMPIFGNGAHCVSCWELDPDEIAEVLRTGRVFLTVVSGPSQPPVYVGCEEDTRRLVADWGVWRRPATVS